MHGMEIAQLAEQQQQCNICNMSHGAGFKPEAALSLCANAHSGAIDALLQHP